MGTEGELDPSAFVAAALAIAAVFCARQAVAVICIQNPFDRTLLASEQGMILYAASVQCSCLCARSHTLMECYVCVGCGCACGFHTCLNRGLYSCTRMFEASALHRRGASDFFVRRLNPVIL